MLINKKELTLLLLLLVVFSLGVKAQRITDKLDRGLVAVQTTNGVFCSWRILAEEYYDVKYNIYRNGTKLNSEPLEVSNYTDTGGAASSSYTVSAVVRGVEQSACAAVTPWEQNYMEIKMDHGSLTSTYIPNDACCADVDGDGQVEILLKFDNQEDAEALYPDAGNNGEYAIIEVYKLNGTKLWWVDLGPNMCDFQNNEQNIVAFDWDGDGKAEAVMRASDGTVIHMADGSTYEVGDMSANYRNGGKGSSQTEFFVHEGQEFLLYLNGETGKPYQCVEYPLKRLESGETDLSAAWGDGYGHRSTKHFFGAPFLDGKTPSIFLARGIYTRHKMIALDVNASTHELTTRWTWNCNDSSSSWYGQGYHNYSIADVDMDGRDEIVFGSMVIDDNGSGLSTTGLGHGDSHHVGDFDPYSPGLEVFACNESQPGNNFRDATTSKIYYRYTSSSDDGRCLMGNFVNDIPGCQGISSRDPGLISSVAHTTADGYTKSSFNITQNFRIYWDGDLCDESFDYVNGKNTAGGIYKAETGLIAKLEGSLTNNDTKGTPDYQGDILGDWREEVIMRTSANNIRIYTTDVATTWRNYSLWYDHQYRNAMVWQMCGYNQTPHVSYFLGEKEGITVAPPPLTMTDRTEIAAGGTIGSDVADKHILLDETGNASYTVAAGAAPYILTDNAPTWVQGHDNNDNITIETYTHTLTGAAFTGSMRLVKQGDGTLVLPDVTETYTGNTDVWGGTLTFNGTMQSSRVWLNRHTMLQTTGGVFNGGIQADYNATIKIGSETAASTLTATDVTLGFGSRVEFDLFSEGTTADQLNATTLTIDTINWTNGPTYSSPVFSFVSHAATGETLVSSGKYLLGTIGTVNGNINNIVIEGLSSQKAAITVEDGKLYINVQNYEAESVTWTGKQDGNWNLDSSVNFVNASNEAVPFVPNDSVTFDDTADSTNITVVGNVAPASIAFKNETKTYTIGGDQILGSPTLTKTGAGSVIFNNTNVMGNTTISGGSLMVSSLANTIGQDYGSLGDVNSTIEINSGATLSVNATSTAGQPIYIGQGGGTLDVPSGLTLTMSNGILRPSNVTTAVLTKTGAGTLTLSTNNKFTRLIIKAGSINSQDGSSSLPSNVEFQGGTLYDSNTESSTSTTSANFIIEEGNKGSLYLDPRCNYTGKITGAGQLTIYAAGVRNQMKFNSSSFEGTIIAASSKRGTYDPSFDWASSNTTSNLEKAILSINSGVTVNAGTWNSKGITAGTIKIGNLKGSGKLNATNAYVGYRNESIGLTNSFNSTNFYKVGTGDWSLTRAISGLNSITLNEGTLTLSNTTTTDMTNSAPITLKSGTEMRGRGTVYSITAESGSTLIPGVYGSSTTYNAITTKSNITVNSGATVQFAINNNNGLNGSRSWFTVGGTLTLNGTINVVADSNYTPAVGDSFTLWTATTFEGTPVIGSLPTLPDGMKWDTSGLTGTTGILTIAETTGITSIGADEEVECSVYTLSGVYVLSFTSLYADLAKVIKAKTCASGTYIVKMKSTSKSEVLKINVK